MLEKTKKVIFELRIECQKLPKLDYFSESDPVVIMSVKNNAYQMEWLEFGRTEVIQNSPNPRFTKGFIFGEEKPLLRFEVYDIDNDSEELKDHDYIGYFETTLEDILWSKNKIMSENLINAKRSFAGRITLMVDEIVETSENIVFQFTVQNIRVQRGVFFEIDRRRKDGHLVLIYRSEPCEDFSSIVWEPFTISLGALCNGDPYQDFVIQLFSFSKDGGHSLIGTTKTSIIELRSLADITSRFLNIASECGKNGIEDIGHLFVKECQISI